MESKSKVFVCLHTICIAKVCSVPSVQEPSRRRPTEAVLSPSINQKGELRPYSPLAARPKASGGAGDEGADKLFEAHSEKRVRP